MKKSTEIFSIKVDNSSAFADYEKRRRSSILQEIRHKLYNATNRTFREEDTGPPIESSTPNGLEGSFKKRHGSSTGHIHNIQENEDKR